MGEGERRTIEATCCVVGGGPAGMMAGLLLARAGVDVVVLEKHADFLRDFRGDTIHPSTLEVMAELGFLDELLTLPHQKAAHLKGYVGDAPFEIADFSRLPVRCPYIAFMPQWDFLDFLARRARRWPGFRLMTRTAATGLVEAEGRIAGVRVEGPDGPLEIRTRLVIAADGRHSTVRPAAGLAVETIGAPMDVLWFRLSRRAGDPEEPVGRFDRGRIFILINRGEHWQCGFVVPKGGQQDVEARGIVAFRAEVARLAPFAADRVDEIASFDEVKLLTVGVDRLRRWHRPGLLCIGDAAHTMSPVGGVGINLAIQDAVAAANILAGPLRAGRIADADLAKVERRRAFPARATQAMQVAIQNRVIAPVLGAAGTLRTPLLLRLFQWFPALRRLPGRLIGMGVRPEHVRVAEVPSPASISPSPLAGEGRGGG